MAAEKKAATPTAYRVLKRDEDPGGGWNVVQILSATSATSAVRSCVSTLAEKEQAGTFVAVPVRSFRPVTVQPQTTIRLEITEAKT